MTDDAGPQLCDFHVVKGKKKPPDEWGIGAKSLGGDAYYMFMRNQDGTPFENPTVWHWCSHSDRWVGNVTSKHQLVCEEPLHLEPSLLCPLCGWHGFIRNGKWESC